MHIRVTRPDQLSPEELDLYLAEGWFRIGQSLMTCRLIHSSRGLRSTIWTRLPLAGHRFSSSARRLLSQNRRRYRVEHRPLLIDAAREALYQRYLTIAEGERSASLSDFLSHHADRGLFDTHEISLWDVDELVALSWFDRGRDSVQSLLGIYEPAFHRDSLGFTTMLLEVDHAAREGLAFHYPGYVLPGDPSMDYKLRLGAMEFLDPWTQAWRPLPELAGTRLPHLALEQALEAVSAALEAAGYPNTLRSYPMFEAPAWQEELPAAIDQPLVVECLPGFRSGTLLLVTHDIVTGSYTVLRAKRARTFPKGRPDLLSPFELWLWPEVLFTASTAEAVAAELQRRARLLGAAPERAE